jgi:beta-glucosidase
MNHLSKPCFLFFALTMLSGFSGWADDQVKQNDAHKSVWPQDVKALVAEMTLAEKVGQMVQTDVAVISPEEAAEHHVGSIISLIPEGNLGTAAAWRKLIDSYQRAMQGTRLSIPVLVGIDAVHGHSYFDGPSVIMPHNIGIGATRNPGLAKRIARATAIELRATGIHWTFSPSIAVSRDIRWGRAFESFGEDVSLQKLFTAPLVEGFQGRALSDPGSVATTLKHFVADGATDGGVDRGNATISMEEIRKMHLPGFIAGLSAGSPAVMASFSSVNGEKVHGSKLLLDDLLRQELGFDGVLLTDWEGVTLSGLSLKQGLDAGIDMFMFAQSWRESLPKLLALVEDGEVSESRIDESVVRILTMKQKLGLFQNPFSSAEFDQMVGSNAHRAIARQAVTESMVLLKNDRDTLPLDPGQSVIVVGSHSNNVAFQSGGWTKKWQGAHLDRFGGAPREIEGATSVIDGIRKLIGADKVVDAGIDQRIEGAETVIIVVGEEPYAEMFGDRKADELVLTKSQSDLIRDYRRMGKRVVTVLVSGRPLLVNEALQDSDAFVAAWLPGSESGGVADGLFGIKPIAGKLGFSWPKSAEQIPVNVGDAEYQPLFPFGYGLTTASP